MTPETDTSSTGGGSSAKPSTKAAKPAAKRTSGERSTSAKSTAAKPAASKSAAGKRTTTARSTAAKRAAAKPATSRGTAATKPAAARPAGAASASAARTAAAKAPAKAADPLRTGIARVRDFVNRGIVVSRDRIQEAMDDAVTRGRIVRRDADELTERILASGRQQTQDLLSDLEQLLGRGREQVGTAASTARVQATRRSEGVLRGVDKARRRARIGSFPILGYDDLTADQIVKRLGDLSAADLRKVRDYETRNANRKSVLDAVQRKLGV